MGSDSSRDESTHIAAIEDIRDQLVALRGRGEISNQFVEWHGRLAANLEVIAKAFPDFANLCEELRSIDFEMPPEFVDRIQEELSDRPRVTSASKEMFFRNRCDAADEILRTLVIVLRRTTS